MQGNARHTITALFAVSAANLESNARLASYARSRYEAIVAQVFGATL